MNSTIFLTNILLFFVTLTFSQQVTQGVLYAKIKPTTLSLKSPSATPLNITESHYFIEKSTLKKRGSTLSKSGFDRMIKINYASTHTPVEAVEILMRTGLYEYVAPSPVFQPLYYPNDTFASPLFDAPYKGQSLLFTHTFWEAWNIEKGDTNVVIAIVDGGINFDHEDLKGNIKINYADTVNGINDDGNHFYGRELIDDYRGWDLGDWDNDPSQTTYTHGSEVTGVASATADNKVGIAGTGFNCRYVHYKIASDATPTRYTEGYDGAIMAGQNGASVINLSWGTPRENVSNSIHLINDLIDYLVYDLDAVVVASAANSGLQQAWYPAAANSAISVTGIDPSDKKQSGSTYDYTVDIAASGFYNKTTRGLTTNDYVNANGTSLAAPVVAGAAALVRSHYPELKAIQVNQLLRVTGDLIDTSAYNKPFQYKMGRKLNPYRALTEFPPAFRLIDFDSTLSASTMGDVVNLSIAVKNYLSPSTPNTKARLISLSNASVVLDSSMLIGHVGTLDLNTPTETFSIGIPAFSDTLTLEFVLEYTDDNMIDHEYLQVTLLPTIVTKTTSFSLENQVTINPNPTSDVINVQFINSAYIENYTLTDALGKPYLTHNLNKETPRLVIDLPKLGSGIYFLTVKTKNNYISKKIFIK